MIKAMSSAIKIVFSETRHRLCTWHIAKNAAQQLATYYTRLELKQYYNKYFYGCSNNATEFEASWVEMIKKFKLEDHSWLRKLYSLKEKWCPAFSLDTFSANTKSTQRSESTDNVSHQISAKTIELITVVWHYDNEANEM